MCAAEVNLDFMNPRIDNFLRLGISDIKWPLTPFFLWVNKGLVGQLGFGVLIFLGLQSKR